MCAAFLLLFPLCAGAEGVILSEFPDGTVFHMEYHPFLSEMPPLPTVERTANGYMISGLSAWGVDPEQFSDLKKDINTDTRVADPDVRYEDAVQIFEAVPDPQNNPYRISGFSFSLKSSCENWDTVEICVSAYPDEENPGWLYSIGVKKGDVSLEYRTYGRYEYKLDRFSVTPFFYVDYDLDGKLTKLCYCPDEEHNHKYLLEKDWNAEGDRPVYFFSYNGKPVEDLNSLPFTLVWTGEPPEFKGPKEK